jgi:hypothetical protein
VENPKNNISGRSHYKSPIPLPARNGVSSSPGHLGYFGPRSNIVSKIHTTTTNTIPSTIHNTFFIFFTSLPKKASVS